MKVLRYVNKAYFIKRTGRFSAMPLSKQENASTLKKFRVLASFGEIFKKTLDEYEVSWGRLTDCKRMFLRDPQKDYNSNRKLSFEKPFRLSCHFEAER